MTLHSPGHEADDVDRLFARLDRVQAPPDLASRILSSAVARAAAPRRAATWPLLVAALGALAALAATGYLVGVQLAAANGLDLLLAVASDLSLLASAPGDVVAALAEVLPLWLVATAAVSIGLVVWTAGQLVTGSPPVRARAGG